MSSGTNQALAHAPQSDSDLTRCLHQLQGGAPGAEARLLELVYDRLRSMAAIKMKTERGNHTLQATALANETYIRLRNRFVKIDWRNSEHFYGQCSRTMRNILIDHARHRRLELEHRADVPDFDLLPELAMTDARSEELLAFDLSLDRLASFDPRGAQVIEMTQILGISREEVAAATNRSVTTVKRDISACMRWLKTDMGFAESPFQESPLPDADS